MLAYSCFIVMRLFSSILVPGELFFIHFSKGMLQTGILSQTPNSASVSCENGESLALHIRVSSRLLNILIQVKKKAFKINAKIEDVGITDD